MADEARARVHSDDDELDVDVLAGMFELQADGHAVSAAVFADGHVTLTQRDGTGRLHHVQTTANLLRQLIEGL
jgi:hypothetical protein